MTTPPLIIDITLTPVWIPFDKPLRTASGILTGSALALVDVQTDAGITGTAYVFTYTDRLLRAVATLMEDVKSIVIGEPIEPRQIADQLSATFTLLGKQGILGMLCAGIDMAIWDALGKWRDAPVCRLMGHEPRPIQAYASFGAFDPQKDRAVIESFVEQGFTGLKIKIGGDTLDDDVACVRGIREIIGADMALMVDYNQSLSVNDALERARAIAPYDIYWIEEPVAAEDLRGHADVRATSPIKVQTGENCWFASGVANALALDACDYFMPDVMKIGGFSGWLAAAKLLASARIPVSSHAFVEASAHALAATPGAHWLEYLDKARPILTEGYDLVDGCITARGPGLGITWDNDAVRYYAPT